MGNSESDGLPFRLRNHDVYRASLKLADANDVLPDVQASGNTFVPLTMTA